MKILWFLDKELDVSLSTSGRLSTIEQLEKKATVTLVTGYRHTKPSYSNLRCKIIYIDTLKVPILKKLIYTYKQLSTLKYLISLNNYDVILVNSLNYLLVKSVVKHTEFRNTKTVFDVRTIPVDAGFVRRRTKTLVFKSALKYASKFFDGITYITDEMRKYCITKYTLPNHKSEVWCSGVDPSMFKNSNDNDSRKNDSNLKIVYHGTLAKNRNLANVINAIKTLEFIIPIKLYVLGAGDGLRELRQLTHKLDLHQKVKFMEPVPYYKVPEIINKSDVGILPFQDCPGWNTSSPIKLFEYLSCEKPVIVTKIPAHTEVLGNSGFAFWADDWSPQGIALAIKDAYKKRESFKRIGIQARQFIMDQYTWEKQIRRLKKFWTNL